MVPRESSWDQQPKPITDSHLQETKLKEQSVSNAIWVTVIEANLESRYSWLPDCENYIISCFLLRT